MYSPCQWTGMGFVSPWRFLATMISAAFWSMSSVTWPPSLVAL